VLTRDQLLVAGLGADAIDYRAKVGRLHRIHRNVYAIGHRPPSPHARAMAAVLACGAHAALSHQSAAALWEIVANSDPVMHVTARSNHALGGVRVHRSRTLTADQITTHFGIPVTTPARTIIDLADVLPDAALARAFNEAQLKRRARIDDIVSLLARSPGRRAANRVSRLVTDATSPTRSQLEDDFLRFVARFRLPVPEVNQRVAGHEGHALARASVRRGARRTRVPPQQPAV
jgi:predicted transcriptional regulator of viral defense system